MKKKSKQPKEKKPPKFNKKKKVNHIQKVNVNVTSSGSGAGGSSMQPYQQQIPQFVPLNYQQPVFTKELEDIKGSIQQIMNQNKGRTLDEDGANHHITRGYEVPKQEPSKFFKEFDMGHIMKESDDEPGSCGK